MRGGENEQERKRQKMGERERKGEGVIKFNSWPRILTLLLSESVQMHQTDNPTNTIYASTSPFRSPFQRVRFKQLKGVK